MDKLANTITDYYVKKEIISEDKREIYSYGFKLIIADIVNYSIVMIIGIITNSLLESIVFLISLCGLRQFSGGFHAKTFWLCRLSMIITYFSVMVAAKSVAYNDCKTAVVLLINTVSVVFICILAPIENPNKPLSDKQKHSNRIKSIITSSFLSAISILLVIAGIECGVTISITLLAVVVLMIIGLAMQKGGKQNV